MKKSLQIFKNHITIVIALIFSILTVNSKAQLTVTAGGGSGAVTGGLGGPGLTISNVTINCPNNAYGQFSNGASSGLGVNAGFMITTGNVSSLIGSNLDDDFSYCNNTSGSDPQLVALSSSATVDPCIIEFDVVPQCNSMSITFVFGSDEYTNWVNQSYNDAFGFFVSGPNPSGGSYNNVNIATIPNGTIVTIDNVSHLSNTAYFINNNAGTYNNSFDGFTTVLTPVISVTPCQSYHFKLAIADATDCAMDSGVLIDIIQCVSPWTVATSSTNADCGVSNGTATATASGGIGPFTYSWNTSPVQNTATATGLPSGSYIVTVNDGLTCTPSQQYTVNVGSNAGTPNTTITPAGPFCQTAAAVNLTAATGGGTWSGTGITNTTNGTFNPATAGPGNHIITYSIGGACPGSSTTTITVNASTTPTFNAHAPICSGGTITLPTTSTNGITGTWSPAINNTNTTTYTFTPNAGQCATTTTMMVTVNNQITPTFAVHPPICSGGTVTLPATSTNGITGAWSPAIDNTTTTTYTFTPAAGQCATTTTMTVNVGSPVTPTFNAHPPICAGGTVTLPTTSTNGFTGTWSPAVDNTTTTTYTFTPSAGQCATTTTMTVNVGSPVTPSFTAIAPICSGGTINLPTTSNDGFTGTWSPAVDNTTTTNYTFTPSAGQCATTTTMSVTVNTIPTMTTPSNVSVCQNDNVAASNFVSNPVGANFDWTNTNTTIGLGASGTGNTPGFIATNGTGSMISGTISVTPTLNGCVGNPISYTITVNDIFDPTISPAGPFCESASSATLSAVDAGGIWSGTGITDAVNGTFDPISAGTGTHTITYTIAGTCGGTDTENIIVNPDMDATIAPAGPFCTNDPAVALTGADTGGTWGGTGITNPTLGIFDPSIALDGTHTITYTIGGACGDEQSLAIIVSQQLDASIVPVGPFCESDPAINMTPAVNTGGVWSGNGITNSVLGTFNPNTAGAGTHTITYALGGNCGDVQTTTITILSNADATITPAGPFCTGNSSVTLSAATAGGVWSGPGITNTATGVFDPAIAGIGTHIISYTIGGQCGDANSISINVVANFDATITPVGPFCTDAASITLNAANGGGTWSGPGITNSTTGTFDPNSAGVGTHTITYTIPGACGATQTTTIVVNPLPVVTFVVDNAIGCIPLTATFTDNSGLTGSTAEWTMSDGFVSSSNGSVTHTFNSVGCFNVTLELTSSAGCIGSSTQNNIVCVSAIPIAEFIWSPINATVLNPNVNFTNISSGATDYIWDFAGLGTSNSTNPSFSFPDDSANIYPVCLVSSNIEGCSDTVCHDITIYDEFLIYIPNTFTPDNDDKNEIFIPILNGYDATSYELLIFNRWGELIFQTDNPLIGWDGTYKSIESKEDTYVWKVSLKSTFDNRVHEYIGHVNLLR